MIPAPAAATGNASIWRVQSPASSPTTTVYATLPSKPNATLAFGPGGTIYVWNDAQIAKVTGTNVGGTPTISNLPGFQLNNLGLLAGGTATNGMDATFLIENPYLNGTAGGIDSLDLTTTPPTRSTSFATALGANFMTFGPDGCLYVSQGTTVFRVTDTSGGCTMEPPRSALLRLCSRRPRCHLIRCREPRRLSTRPSITGARRREHRCCSPSTASIHKAGS